MLIIESDYKGPHRAINPCTHINETNNFTYEREHIRKHYTHAVPHFALTRVLMFRSGQLDLELLMTCGLRSRATTRTAGGVAPT